MSDKKASERQIIPVATVLQNIDRGTVAPHFLTCEQTIRIHAVGHALNLAGRSFDRRIQVQSVLEDTQTIANYITDGTIPTTAGDPE